LANIATVNDEVRRSTDRELQTTAQETGILNLQSTNIV